MKSPFTNAEILFLNPTENQVDEKIFSPGQSGAENDGASIRPSEELILQPKVQELELQLAEERKAKEDALQESVEIIDRLKIEREAEKREKNIFQELLKGLQETLVQNNELMRALREELENERRAKVEAIEKLAVARAETVREAESERLKVESVEKAARAAEIALAEEKAARAAEKALAEEKAARAKVENALAEEKAARAAEKALAEEKAARAAVEKAVNDAVEKAVKEAVKEAEGARVAAEAKVAELIAEKTALEGAALARAVEEPAVVRDAPVLRLLTQTERDEYEKKLSKFFENVSQYLLLLKNEHEEQADQAQPLTLTGETKKRADDLFGLIDDFRGYHSDESKIRNIPGNDHRDFLIKCFDNESTLRLASDNQFDIGLLKQKHKDDSEFANSLKELKGLQVADQQASLRQLVKFLPQFDLSEYVFIPGSDDVNKGLNGKVQSFARGYDVSFVKYAISNLLDASLEGEFKSRRDNLSSQTHNNLLTTGISPQPSETEKTKVLNFSQDYSRLKPHLDLFDDATALSEIKDKYNLNRFVQESTDHIDIDFKKHKIPLFRVLKDELKHNSEPVDDYKTFKRYLDIYQDLCSYDRAAAAAAAPAPAPAAAAAAPAPAAPVAPAPAPVAAPAPAAPVAVTQSTSAPKLIKYLLLYAKKDDVIDYKLLVDAYKFCEEQKITDPYESSIDKKFVLQEFFKKQEKSNMSTLFESTITKDQDYKKFIEPHQPKNFLNSCFITPSASAPAPASTSTSDSSSHIESVSFDSTDHGQIYDSTTSRHNNQTNPPAAGTRVVNIFQFTSKAGQFTTDTKIFLSNESEKSLFKSMEKTKELLDKFKILDGVSHTDMQSVIGYIKGHESLKGIDSQKKAPFDLEKFDRLIDDLLKKTDPELREILALAKTSHSNYESDKIVYSNNLTDQLYGELLADNALMLTESVRIDRVQEMSLIHSSSQPEKVYVSSTDDFKGTIQIKSSGPTPTKITFKDNKFNAQGPTDIEYSQYTKTQDGFMKESVLQSKNNDAKTFKDRLTKINEDLFYIKKQANREYCLYVRSGSSGHQIHVYSEADYLKEDFPIKVTNEIDKFIRDKDSNSKITDDTKKNKFHGEVKIFDLDNENIATITNVKANRNRKSFAYTFGYGKQKPEKKEHPLIR